MALPLRRHARARVSLHGLLTSCLLLASLPASGCEDASGAPAPDSAQRFGVGTAAYEWRDASRAELATPEPGDVRRIRARAWYPASADASARAPYFLSPLQAELNAQAVGLAPDTFASVTLPAQADAAAAAQSCQLDPRFVACANLDGSVGTALLPAAIAQPFLLLRSELEESTLRGFFDEVAGPIHRVEIAGAGHNSFTDLPRLVRDLSLPLDPEGLLLGSLGAERAFEINASFVAGFFDAELCEGSSALFLEPSPFAEVTLTNRMPAVAEK